MEKDESSVIMQRKNQKYFLLNINEHTENEKKRENTVDYWMNKEFAPIFYRGNTLDQIRKNEDRLTPNQHKDAKSFVDTFSNTEDKVVFSIGEEKIYFFEQAGKLVPFEADKEDGIKGFPIKILEERYIKDCPLVLASIKANRWFSSGTFKELIETNYFGNIQAIKYVLYHENINISNFTDYLNCLSSLEFETLIAKILEEQGFFVPAYKGGYLKNFDLICKNFERIPLKVVETEIVPNKNISIQIKLKLKKSDYKYNVDFYFCITDSKMSERKKNVFDAETIQTLLYKSKTFDWLKKTLFWINYE